MQITSSTNAGQFVLKLKGRMDAGWSDHVAGALAECLQSGQHVLSLDMAEVDYISSAGIRILVLYARKLKAIQGSFSVVNASAQVRRVLELSGLATLLFQATAAPAAQETARTSEPIALAEPGATAELFDLDSQASLRVDWPGDPRPWLEGTPDRANRVKIEFPANTIGLGLGGFGEEHPGVETCLGEFLAAAGAAVCLPADGSNKPDYVLQEQALTPSLDVAYGMIGTGGFRQLLRFDKGPQLASLPLSSVLKACLKTTAGKPAGFVMVTETASLTGVSLQKMPSGEKAGSASSLFAFPAVRDWLNFTAEPAFPNTTSLIVGFAAGREHQAGLRLLKPAVPSGEIQAHVHAAAFPYQPLRKGKVDLQQTLRPLFESGQILGLLHLLNDWREVNGAGESQFLRGACWWSPLVV